MQRSLARRTSPRLTRAACAERGTLWPYLVSSPCEAPAMRFERCEVEGPAPGTSELAAHLNCRNKSLTFIKPDLCYGSRRITSASALRGGGGGISAG